VAELLARGLSFHVQRLGSGKPAVVFLHGLVMDNLSSWYFSVANRVAKNAEVFLYDLRGHGRSERPPKGYTVDDMVADLAALLSAADLHEPVYLVGNSFGGLLALQFALAWPDRAAGLVLVDSHLNDGDWGAQMAHTLGLTGEERNHMIAEHFQSWLGRHSQRKRTRLAQTAEALVYGTSLIDDLQNGRAIDEAALAQLQCPILALYGEQSDILDRGQWLAASVRDCRLEILPGCTHSVLWEATQTVASHITQWLEAQT
jgi:pimeloyl-ACP methyl ester carboxylesterase